MSGAAPSSAGDVPTGRCARREVRAGRSMVTGATWAVGAADVEAADVGAADGAVELGATDAEPPDWRALIAVTRSPLRILAVPLRPRPPARPWSSASFMVLRAPVRLGVSTAPLVGALARSVVFVTKDPSPS